MGEDQDEIDDLEFQKMLDLMNSIERPQELKEMTSSVVVHANKEVKKKTKKTVNVPVPEKQEYVDPLEAWKGKLRVVFIVGLHHLLSSPSPPNRNKSPLFLVPLPHFARKLSK